MAVTTIKVDPQKLLEASIQTGGIADLAKDYEKEYKALFDRVSNMKGKWDGQDNQNYTDQVEGFRDDFEKMKSLMDQYSEYLKNTAQAYINTQNEIAKTAKGLTN